MYIYYIHTYAYMCTYWGYSIYLTALFLILLTHLISPPDTQVVLAATQRATADTDPTWGNGFLVGFGGLG